MIGSHLTFPKEDCAACVTGNAVDALAVSGADEIQVSVVVHVGPPKNMVRPARFERATFSSGVHFVARPLRREGTGSKESAF